MLLIITHRERGVYWDRASPSRRLDNIGTKEFHDREEEASKKFDNHGATFLSEKPILHNGALISVKMAYTD